MTRRTLLLPLAALALVSRVAFADPSSTASSMPPARAALRAAPTQAARSARSPAATSQSASQERLDAEERPTSAASVASTPIAPPPSNAPAPVKAPAQFGVRQTMRQASARVWTQTKRAVTLPAFVWPGTRIAKAIAHGEPFSGATPKSAVDVAERIADERGTGAVIGRLAWELHDIWSTRGAERSYTNLIGEIAQAKAKRPGLDVSVSCDPESLGLQLKDLSWEQRERIAAASILRIGRVAKQHGVPIELDMGTSDAMPHTINIAHRIARDLRVPIRLAIAARYQSSEKALREWIALARETGVKLGVRLVKGSFIEAEQPDAINQRGPLLDHYKRLITIALENSDAIDVAVASQNDGIWDHTRTEAARLRANFTMNVIRGVNPDLQAKMRAAGKLSREYVSYGIDAPSMGVTELLTNRRERRELIRKGTPDVD